MFLGLVHEENQDRDEEDDDISTVLEFLAGNDDDR